MVFPDRPETTIAFFHRLRCKDGGYVNRLEEPGASLQPTVGALKALRTLNAAPEDPAATLDFVLSCFDQPSGGFGSRPGEEPGVLFTALGLIALRELGQGAASDARAAGAMRFMEAHASSAADYFMMIAAHEEGLMPPPAPVAATGFFRAQPLAHGSFGAGARINAICGAALLRAKESLEEPEVLIRRLHAAQGSDGGFSDVDGQPSDLMTTYLAMRALTLLRSSPDLDSLSRYLHRLRAESGGYGAAPGGPATADATYQVLSIVQSMQALRVRASGTAPAAATTDIAATVRAARMGDVAMVRRWLVEGGDPDAHDAEGWTPLLAAAVRGRAEVVNLLLFHDSPGARRANSAIRLEAADALPIYMAGQAGDVETARLLLRDRPEHLLAISSVNGHTVLLQATFFGFKAHQQLAEFLLDNVAEILGLPPDDENAVQDARKRLLVATNVRGYNALGMARLWRNEPMIALLERYPQPTDAERKAYLGNLLSRIAPALPQSEQGRRAQALTEGLICIIEEGLQRMANIPAAETAAIAVARDQILSTVQGLLEIPGLEINRLGGRLQQPPLVVTATGQDTHPHVSVLRKAIATLLLERGADPDLSERHPMAVDAVIRAAVLNHLYLLKLFAGYMAPEALAAAMNAKPAINGLTALHDSVHRALTAPAEELPRHLEQIRWMVEHGARFDIEDYTGRTQAAMAREALSDSNLREKARATLEALELRAP